MDKHIQSFGKFAKLYAINEKKRNGVDYVADLGKELLEEVSKAADSYFDENPVKIYVDRNEELSDEDISLIVNKGMQAYYESVFDNDNYHDNGADSAASNFEYQINNGEFGKQVESIFKKYGKDLSDYDENDLYEILISDYELSIPYDLDYKQLFRNTGHKHFTIVLENAEEGLSINERGYAFEYSGYTKTVIDFLGLNPKEVKDYFISKDFFKVPEGRFPNKKTDPLVTVKSFYEEVREMTYPCELVFFGSIDTSDFLKLENDFKEVTKVKLAKDIGCGFYDRGQGSGSQLALNLSKSIDLDLSKKYENSKFRITLDSEVNGYGIDDVFGLSNDSWDGKIEIVQ